MQKIVYNIYASVGKPFGYALNKFSLYMYSNCLKLQHVHEVFVKFKLSLTMALAGFLTFALIRGALASGYNGTINELSVCIDDSDCQDVSW